MSAILLNTKSATGRSGLHTIDTRERGELGGHNANMCWALHKRKRKITECGRESLKTHSRVVLSASDRHSQLMDKLDRHVASGALQDAESPISLSLLQVPDVVIYGGRGDAVPAVDHEV